MKKKETVQQKKLRLKIQNYTINLLSAIVFSIIYIIDAKFIRLPFIFISPQSYIGKIITFIIIKIIYSTI